MYMSSLYDYHMIFGNVIGRTADQRDPTIQCAAAFA